MKIKAKQVAKDLGVSTATVSLAMNNKPGVNENTRKKIIDYIRQVETELETPANAQKASIKMLFFIGEERTFGTADRDLFSLSYMEIFQQVSRSEYNFKMVCINTDDDIRRAIQESEQDDTAGIFVLSDGMPRRQAELFRGISIPVMFYDNEYGMEGFDHVNINNDQGIRTGLQYLMDLGHRDIIYFHNAHEVYNFGKRRAAFRRYMQEYNLPFHKGSMVEAGSSIDQNYQSIKEYLNRGGAVPSACFCENFAVSIGMIKALQDAGYRVGEDVSVIGVDELPSSVLLDFNLTHIQVLHSRKARIAIARLLDRVRGHADEDIEIYVNTRLIRGNSVKDINLS